MSAPILNVWRPLIQESVYRYLEVFWGRPWGRRKDVPKLSKPEIEIVGPGAKRLLIGKSGLLLPNEKRNWLVRLLPNDEVYPNVTVRAVEVKDAPNPPRFESTKVIPGKTCCTGFW